MWDKLACGNYVPIVLELRDSGGIKKKEIIEILARHD